MGSGRIDPLFRRIEAGDALIVTQLARSTRDLLNVIDAVTKRGAGFRSLGHGQKQKNSV
jgi:hypothetical protein